MQDPLMSTARALGAVADATELLKLAHGAVERARTEVSSDALGVADRLSQQVQFLLKIAEVLRHEIERLERERGALPSPNPTAIHDRSEA
jgi:hypothetical protein